MWRLILVFLGVPIWASTVTVIADCGTSSQRIDDYGSVQCRSNIGDAYAQANQLQVSAGSNLSSFGSVDATASIVDEITLTFFGGTGDALYLPCFDGSAGGGYASGNLGTYGFSIEGPGTFGSSCAGKDASSATRFTFGVPQMLDLSLRASASSYLLVRPSSGAGMSLLRFEVFDLSGQPLAGVTQTLVGTPATIPEPRNSIAVAMVLLALGGVARRFPARR